MMRINKRNLLKGIVRVNFGFALMRCNSLGVVWPEKTSIHLGEWIYKKLRKL